MESKVNSIVFTEGEFGDNLYAAVAKQIELLMQSEHVCVVRKDEVGIIVIEFEHDNRWEYFGNANPVWLTEEEEELLSNNVERMSENDN